MELEEQIAKQLAKRSYHTSEAFVAKSVQLHDTMRVKNGVILIGPSMSGKTTLIETLQSAYKALSKIEQLVHKKYEPV